MNNAIRFIPGSKIIFVAGGYQGGQERAGVVLGIASGDVYLAMLDSEPGAASNIEGFAVRDLRERISKGRIPGSLAEVRLVAPVNAPPLFDSSTDIARMLMSTIG